MRSLIVLSAALVLCCLSTAAPAVPSLAGRQDDHCQVTTVYVTAPASDDHCQVTTIYVTATASDDNGIHTTGTNTKSYATVTVTIPGPIVTDTTTVYVSPTSSQSGDHNSDTDLTVAPCFNEKTSTADSDVTITRTHTDFQTITVTVDDASTNNGIAATTVVHRLHEGFSVDTTTVVVAETIWMQGASTLPSSPATTIRSTSDNSAVAVIVSVPVFPMKTQLQAMRTETTSTYARSESLNVLPSSSSTVIGSPIPLSSLSSGSLVPSTEVNATSRMQATAQATVSLTTRPITLGYGYSGLSRSHMASFTALASHSYSANSSDEYPVATPTIRNTAGISANYTGPRATPSGFTSSVPAYNQSVVLPSQTSLALGGFGSNSTFATSIKANSTILISTYSSQIASSTGTLADVNSTNSELSSSSSSTYPTRFTVIRPTKMTETGPTSSKTKRPMSTAYNTTFDSYTYSFTSSSTSKSTVSSDFTLVEPTLVTLNPAVTTSCVDSSPSSSFATFISSTVEAASSVITNSSESSSTISANISIPTAASSAACGEQGIFSLNFDDLPPLPENLTDVPPVPIFSPYHHFWFSEGFVLAPPPKGPYLPSSKPLLVEFLTQSDIDTTRNDNLHAPGAYGATGEIGNGPNLSWGCYSFDAVAASVGCDSLGAPCDWQFTGVTYDVVTDKYSEVITQRLSTPSCPEGTDCPLTNIVFLDSFASIQSLRINVTVAGVPKIWWMDDLKLDWADNSCEAGQCRASHR